MRIKSMGSEDVRIIPVGSHFDHRLAEPTTVELRWDWNNGHLIDTTDEAFKGVPDEVWQLVLQEVGFQDVSKDKVAPVSQAEALWKSRQVSPTNLVNVPPPGETEATAEDEGEQEDEEEKPRRRSRAKE